MRSLVLATLIASLSITACSAPPAPKEQYFRLIAAPAEAAATQSLDGVVVVAPFSAEGVMAERPLLFTANDGRKLEQRNYAYWTDAPPEMLRDQLIAYLRSANIAPNVVPSELRIAAKYEVKSVIHRLEQVGGDSPAGAITIEFSLIERETDSLIVNRTYAVAKPAADNSIDSAVAALNEGLDEIFGSFVTDLQTAL